MDLDISERGLMLQVQTAKRELVQSGAPASFVEDVCQWVLTEIEMYVALNIGEDGATAKELEVLEQDVEAWDQLRAEVSGMVAEKSISALQERFLCFVNELIAAEIYCQRVKIGLVVPLEIDEEEEEDGLVDDEVEDVSDTGDCQIIKIADLARAACK